jgi:hypothetical protein
MERLPDHDEVEDQRVGAHWGCGSNGGVDLVPTGHGCARAGGLRGWSNEWRCSAAWFSGVAAARVEDHSKVHMRSPRVHDLRSRACGRAGVVGEGAKELAGAAAGTDGDGAVAGRGRGGAGRCWRRPACARGRRGQTGAGDCGLRLVLAAAGLPHMSAHGARVPAGACLDTAAALFVGLL